MAEEFAEIDLKVKVIVTKDTTGTQPDGEKIRMDDPNALRRFIEQAIIQATDQDQPNSIIVIADWTRCSYERYKT